MPYNVNKYDGTFVATVADGSVDQSTSITLIGKNYAAFGEVFNENLVWMLENFANSTPPENPIIGQLWYDTTTSSLKIFDGLTFKSSTGIEISSTVPENSQDGTLWFNSQTTQLNVASDGVFTVVGPLRAIDRNGQIISNTEVVPSTLIDTSNAEHAVIKILVNSLLVAIVSSTSFTIALPGFNSIVPGINLNSTIVLNGTANNANKLGNKLPADYVLATDGAFVNKATFADDGFSVDTAVTVNAVNDNVSVKLLNQNTSISFLTDNGQSTPLVIKNTACYPGSSNNIDLGQVNFRFDTVYANLLKGVSESSNKLQISAGINTSFYAGATLQASPNTVAARDALGDITANMFKGTASSALSLKDGSRTIPAGELIQINTPSFTNQYIPVQFSVAGVQFGSANDFRIQVSENSLLLKSGDYTPIKIRGSNILPGNPITGVSEEDQTFYNNIGAPDQRFNIVYAKTINADSVIGNLVSGLAEHATLADVALRANGVRSFNGAEELLDLPVANKQNIIDTLPIRISSSIGPSIDTNILGNAQTVSDGVYASTVQTITGEKTFIEPIRAISGLTADGIISTTSHFSGRLVGTLDGEATTAKTVTTAAQPNITSVGVMKGITIASGMTIMPELTNTAYIGSSVNRFERIYATVFDGKATDAFTSDYSTLAAEIDQQANSATIPAVSSNSANTIALRDSNGDFSAREINATAARARYADLAEKYLSDNEYAFGTVVCIGGEAEITAATSTDYPIGVISKNPAFIMNSELEGGQYVALKGRTPVRVIGKIQKGDRLVPHSNGIAKKCEAIDEIVFAIAIESSHIEGEKYIEAVIL